ILGGGPGARARAFLNPGSAQSEVLPSKFVRRLQYGDVLRAEMAAAGGYGDPLERDPAAVGGASGQRKNTGGRCTVECGGGGDGGAKLDAAATALERRRRSGSHKR